MSVWADGDWMLGDDGKLGDNLASAIVEHGPSSGSDLALRVGARKATVLRTLNTDARFERIGRGALTRWDVTAQHRRRGRWEPRGTDASRRPDVLLPPSAGDAEDARQRA